MQAKNSLSYSSTAFRLETKVMVEALGLLDCALSIGPFQNSDPNDWNLSPYLVLAPDCHQMGLGGKTIKGFMCSNCTLKAISLASVQGKRWTVTSRSRETSSEIREGRRVVVSTEKRGTSISDRWWERGRERKQGSGWIMSLPNEKGKQGTKGVSSGKCCDLYFTH